jgi:hypothetical protein
MTLDDQERMFNGGTGKAGRGSKLNSVGSDVLLDSRPSGLSRQGDTINSLNPAEANVPVGYLNHKYVHHLTILVESRDSIAINRCSRDAAASAIFIVSGGIDAKPTTRR